MTVIITHNRAMIFVSYLLVMTIHTLARRST